MPADGRLTRDDVCATCLLHVQLHPGKGSAVLFYDLLQDGNVDDLSLHVALPITQGEKWLANVWIWDPKYHQKGY
jgi:hypothetical protein